MPEFLKGNYNIKSNNIKSNNKKNKANEDTKTLTEEFEASALAKLGGSICFVSKSGNLLWDGDNSSADSK